MELLILIVGYWWAMVPGVLLSVYELIQIFRRARTREHTLLLAAALSWSLLPPLVFAFYGMQAQRDQVTKALATERGTPSRKRLAELEEQVSKLTKPRELTQEAREHVFNSLRSVSLPPHVFVQGVNAAAESEGLKVALVEIFRRLGCAAKRDDSLFGSTVGLHIDAVADNPAAKAFVSAMGERGFPVELRVVSQEAIRDMSGEGGDDWSANDIYITVGLPDPTFSSSSEPE